MHRKTRVMIAVIGNGEGDGRHKAAARALRDDGCEVIFVGADQDAALVASSALQEDVDAVLAWIAGGAAIAPVTALREALDAADLSDIPLLAAGAADREIPGAARTFDAADRAGLVEHVRAIAAGREGARTT